MRVVANLVRAHFIIRIILAYWCLRVLKIARSFMLTKSTKVTLSNFVLMMPMLTTVSPFARVVLAKRQTPSDRLLFWRGNALLGGN